MARKIKIPNEAQKRYARQEKKRKMNVKQKRLYYLIVCEGAKTEPNYFNGLKQDLPKGVLTYCQIDIEGTGKNTLSLVEEATQLKKKYQAESARPIDRLWVVFDRDSFTANDFNSAIAKCKNSTPAIGCAWSNEAFELWYLLHFHFYQNAMGRLQYQGLIEDNLRPALGENYAYQKNSTEMYSLLKAHGNVAHATARAKQLAQPFEGQAGYADHNPCTMVYQLIEELLNLNTETI